jgi:hypothetical protein
MEQTLNKIIQNLREYCVSYESTTKQQEKLGSVLSDLGIINKKTTGFSELLMTIGENIKTLAMLQHGMLVNQIEKIVKPSLDFLEYFKENKYFNQ